MRQRHLLLKDLLVSCTTISKCFWEGVRQLPIVDIVALVPPTTFGVCSAADLLIMQRGPDPSPACVIPKQEGRLAVACVHRSETHQRLLDVDADLWTTHVIVRCLQAAATAGHRSFATRWEPGRFIGPPVNGMPP